METTHFDVACGCELKILLKYVNLNSMMSCVTMPFLYVPFDMWKNNKTELKVNLKQKRNVRDKFLVQLMKDNLYCLYEKI